MKKSKEELELEQVLKEMEEDDSFKNVTVPDRVAENLFAQMAAYKAAVADIEPVEATRKKAEMAKLLEDDFEKKAEDTKDNVVPIKSKYKKRSKKAVVLVAVAAILIMATGIVSVGKEYKWLQVLKGMWKEEQVVVVESGEDVITDSEYSEGEAFELAKEILGSDVVSLLDTNNILEFDFINISEGLGVTMFYKKGETIVTYNIVQNKDALSHFEMQTGELEEEYVVTYSDVEITVSHYVEENGSDSFKATFTYQNLFYSVKASMEEEIFLEILNNLYFF